MNAQKRIRQLMEERGWTDYRLAKEANLSHSTVTNMFNRNNAPTLPTLKAVCKAFGITLAQFFTENEESPITEEQQKLFSTWSTLTDEQKRSEKQNFLPSDRYFYTFYFESLNRSKTVVPHQSYCTDLPQFIAIFPLKHFHAAVLPWQTNNTFIINDFSL